MLSLMQVVERRVKCELELLACFFSDALLGLAQLNALSEY